jgi:zinc protease
MRQIMRFTGVTAALLLTLAAFSQTLPSGVQKVTSVEGITEYAYPNGLRVLLFPDPSKPKLTVNITYLVGSRHEGSGEMGMAHLMEHMLFLRTKDGRDVKKEMTDHGAQWNGTTSYDRTNYFETVTASDENLRWAIQLEATRMVNMRIEKELLDTEMTVVRNEFEMGENNPTNILYQRALEAAYIFHPYGRPTIGNRSDIERVPIERLAVFYGKFYQPDNAVLTIAGQFDGTKALNLVADSLGAIPRPARKLEGTYTVEPTQDGERQVTLRRVGDIQAIMDVYHTPAATHPDSAALDVLATILGDNPSGRLYKGLVDNKKAVAIGAGDQDMHDPGFFLSFVILRQDQSIDDARETLLKVVEGVASEPPSKEEVERAKTRILKQFDLNLTNSQSIGLTISEYAASGDWRLLFLSRDRVKSVTEQDVARVAKAYLKASNRTLGEFIPTKSPDRAEIPVAPEAAALLKDYKGGTTISEGEAFVPTAANIEGRVQRTRLPNGMKLVMLPKKTRGGTVVVQIGLQFGDEKSIQGKGAAAQLAGGVLIRGTRNKSRQQIQDEIDRLKARINVSGGAAAANASIETTQENLAGALRLVAEILRQPSLPESEIEQVRQLNIAGMENARSEPQFLAVMEMQRHLNPYPRDDPRYAGTPEERIADLKKATVDQVRQFYTQFYGGSNAEFVISGQFDAAEVRKLAAELFGDWKSPAHFERLTDPYRKVETLDRKIETPDKQNAVFMGGMNFKLSMEDRDYPALTLANYIFGGSGGSRLFKRIRDKEGLSYGVSSFVGVPNKDDGSSFGVQSICNPANAPKVEASFRDELARTVKDGFTAEEVELAKKSWLEQRMVQRSTDQALLATLLNRERFDRTMKFDEALETAVSGLTLEHVNDAFRRYVDPAAMTYVKAGDFKKAGVLQ